MSSKDVKQFSPLERGVRKMDVLMRTFGMRTRMFKGSTRAIVKGARKNYPEEIKATVVETARGVGIRISSEKIWYSFLKVIPFVFLITISILQFVASDLGTKMANGIGINLFHLLIGTNSKPVGIWITLSLIAAIAIGAEIIERIIRKKYIQDRMPRFLSGAEWTVKESPPLLDIFSASNNIFWLMWIFLVLIFAPFSFSTEIYTKFIEVYQTESSQLIQNTLLMSILDIGIISGILFAILYLNYNNFRSDLDSSSSSRIIRFERESQEIIQVAIGATVLATLEYSVFSFMFWSQITILQIIIFYSITIFASSLAVWLFWQKESYNFIAIEIWLFLSIVIMVFLNANQPGYSWMIICHLFLIVVVLGLFLNLSLREYLEKKGLTEPSWIFNPFPLLSLIQVLKGRTSKTARGVEKELEEIRSEEMIEKAKEREPLTIKLDKIKEKGDEAENIVRTYQKIINRMIREEVNLIILADINSEILKTIPDDNSLKKDVNKLFHTVDRLLWEDDFSLQNGKEILQIANELYDSIIKSR